MLMMPTSGIMLKDCGERAMEACEEAFGNMKIWSKKLPKQLSLGSLSMSPRSLTPVKQSDTCDSAIGSCDNSDRLSSDSSDKGVNTSDTNEKEGSSSDKISHLGGRVRSARRSLSRLRSKSCERYFRRKRNNQRDRSQSPTMVVVTPGRTSRVTPCPVAYTGPFIGRARAKVDYVPSPYDNDALRFKAGDIIHIISKNANGLWEGSCLGKTGKFKFINVEIISSSARRGRSRGDVVLTTIPHLLTRLGLEEHIAKFVLNGYDTINSVYNISKEDLDYLGILDPSHQTAILTAMDLIGDLQFDPDDPDEDESTSSHVLSRHDSGCYDALSSDLSYSPPLPTSHPTLPTSPPPLPTSHPPCPPSSLPFPSSEPLPRPPISFSQSPPPITSTPIPTDSPITLRRSTHIPLTTRNVHQRHTIPPAFSDISMEKTNSSSQISYQQDFSYVTKRPHSVPSMAPQPSSLPDLHSCGSVHLKQKSPTPSDYSIKFAQTLSLFESQPTKRTIPIAGTKHKHKSDDLSIVRQKVNIYNQIM